MAGPEKYSHKITKKIKIKIPRTQDAWDKLCLVCESQGGLLGNARESSVARQGLIREITVFFDTQEQFFEMIAAVKKMKNYEIIEVEDEILNVHRGGKIEITPRVRIDSIADLRKVYTPGVAQVCNYIVKKPEAVREYTSIGNTVCIATNGSAVLGLGNIGVAAAMPVMEGKSVILYKMGGVSCQPILIDSDNADRIVDVLAGISKTFGAIMLEDIGAPLCFEVEKRLQERLDIPVFHDDQHGTATVILAGLIKALVITGKNKGNVKIIINGAGAAGIATTKLLLRYGFKHLILCDRSGAIYQGRPGDMNPYKKEIAEITNKKKEKGSLQDVIKNKDIFIGLSGPQLVSKEMIMSMNKKAIVFALANPIPEIWPEDALNAGAAVALDGRIINNALAFPGIIRGALDSGACAVSDEMKIEAARTLASLAPKKGITPDFMDKIVHEKVAQAVIAAAKK